jgi:hypothetical protein
VPKRTQVKLTAAVTRAYCKRLSQPAASQGEFPTKSVRNLTCQTFPRSAETENSSDTELGEGSQDYKCSGGWSSRWPKVLYRCLLTALPVPPDTGCLSLVVHQNDYFSLTSTCMDWCNLSSRFSSPQFSRAPLRCAIQICLRFIFISSSLNFFCVPAWIEISVWLRS